MDYRCVAPSVAGFVQQLAVGYVAHGYWFYVTGRIPDHKDPARVDQKLVAKYGLDISKWMRARRKKKGQARVQYLRYDRFFVLLATHGEHAFFAEERKQIQDIRRRPICFMGYSIGCRRGRRDQAWHPSVRIERTAYRKLKAHFEDLAVHRSIDDLIRELRAISYERYAPVRDQLRQLLGAVNRRRKLAALELIPPAATCRRRVPVKPFEPVPSA